MIRSPHGSRCGCPCHQAWCLRGVTGTGQRKGHVSLCIVPAETSGNHISHQAVHEARPQQRAGSLGVWDVRYPQCQLEKSRGSPFLNSVAARDGGHHSRAESPLSLLAVGNIALASGASSWKVLILSAQLEQHRRYMVVVVGEACIFIKKNVEKKVVCTLLRLPTLANSIFHF